MMDENSNVRIEDGLTIMQWLEKRQTALEWEGDLYLCLAAIGLKRGIAVITSVYKGKIAYARRYPCKPKPPQKMRGDIFIPLTCDKFLKWWKLTASTTIIIQWF